MIFYPRIDLSRQCGHYSGTEKFIMITTFEKFDTFQYLKAPWFTCALDYTNVGKLEGTIDCRKRF